MLKTENREKLLPILFTCVAVIGLLCALVFFLMSVTSSYYLGTDKYLGTIEELRPDNAYVNILALIIICCALYLSSLYYDMIDMKLLITALMVWTFVSGFGFVYSASRIPAGDAEIIVNAAFNMAQGKTGVMQSYFDQYPFRLGLTLFYELFFRIMIMVIPSISRGYCSMAMQVMNVFFLMLSYYAILKICDLTYLSGRVTKLTAIFLFFCLPANLSCTSLSGRMPAMMFSLLGILFFMKYYRENKVSHILLCIFFCGFAQALKLDSAIILIAILAVAFCSGVSFKKLRDATLALVLFIFILVSPTVPAMLYELRGDNHLNGTELSVYSAMGFAEEEDAYLAYDELYSAVNHAVSQKMESKEESAGLSWESVHEQWNEPSFRTLHNNRGSQHYRDTGPFYRLLCYEIDSFCLGTMGIWQSIILFGFAAGNLFLIKKDYVKLLLSLCVIGGVLFHLIYQVQSQHAMKYYLLMVPVAAYGFENLFNLQHKKGES